MYPFIIFMNRISCVYKITSPSNKYYIGSTNNLKRRLKEHFYGGVNPYSLYIKSACAKYGEDNLTVEILFETEDRELAYKKEQEYLTEHFNDPLCMNVKENAKGFNSEQAKYARSKVENIFDLNNYMLSNPDKLKERGKILSDNYKKNLQMGISNSQQQRGAKYVEVFDPNGNSLGKFESIKLLQAAFPIFVSVGNIASVARGKIKHYKKHTFKYTD